MVAHLGSGGGQPTTKVASPALTAFAFEMRKNKKGGVESRRSSLALAL